MTTTKAPANTATPVTKARVTAFVKAYKRGEETVVAKARVIGESIASGATVGKVTEQLRDALIEQNLIVPKSFGSSVTHYNTAYRAASTLDMTANDAVLHALYQISTGVVKASDRDAFVLYHQSNGSSAEEIVSSVRLLITKSRAASKATPKADHDADVATAVSEIEAEIGSSPLADLASILKQAGAILDVLADNDDEAYDLAVTALTEFAGKYLAGGE